MVFLVVLYSSHCTMKILYGCTGMFWFALHFGDFAKCMRVALAHGKCVHQSRYQCFTQISFHNLHTNFHFQLSLFNFNKFAFNVKKLNKWNCENSTKIVPIIQFILVTRLKFVLRNFKKKLQQQLYIESALWLEKIHKPIK